MGNETIITKDGIVADRIRLRQTLTLGSSSITQIIGDFAEDDPESLPQSQALFNGLAQLQKQLTTLSTQVSNNTQSIKVFSNNLVSSNFQTLVENPTLGWDMRGFSWDGASAYITNGTGYDAGNELLVPSGRYPKAGQYFMIVTVGKISGTLTLCLNDVPVQTITTAGAHAIGFTIDNPATDRVYFQCSNIVQGQTTQLTKVCLTYVISTLFAYITYLIQQAITNDNQNIQQLIENIVQPVSDILQQHLIAVNPHHITCAMIGAAEAVHTHPQYLDRQTAVNVEPDTISFAVIGEPPNEFPSMQPAQTIKSRYLSHDSLGYYSPYSGTIYSSQPDVPNLGAAVYSEAVPQDRYALFSIGPTGSTVVGYRFQMPRTVQSVVLYTQGSTQFSAVSALTITVGTTAIPVTLDQTQVIPGTTAVAITVPVQSVTSDNVELSVTRLVDETKLSFALGFDVIFADTPTDVALVGGTTFSYVDSVGLQSYMLPGDIPLDTSGLINEHTYTISYAMTPSPSIELLPVLPIASINQSEFDYPLKHLTGSSDPYFGSTSITGLDPSCLGSEYTIYQDGSNLKYSGNTVVIQQSFVLPCNIDHVDLLLDTDLSDIASITISTVINGKTVSQTLTSGLSVKTLQNMVKVTAEYNQSPNPVSSVGIAITGSSAPPLIRKVDVAFETVVNNEITHLWSDGVSRKIFGLLTKHNNGRYSIYCLPIGKSCMMPVNDVLPTTFYTNYKITNPFFSRDIKTYCNCGTAIGVYTDMIHITPYVDKTPIAATVSRQF